MASEPAKHQNVLLEIKQRARRHRILFSDHGQEREQQRNVNYADIRRVLLTGEREPERDLYKDKHRSWSYAIKGETVDGRLLRVVVVLIRPGLLVVTVVSLGQEQQKDENP